MVEPRGTISGDPDLAGTRWLCFGSAMPCAFFALWLPMATAGAMDRLDPGGRLFAEVLVFVAVGLALVATLFLLRSGFTVGAQVRVDEHGFRYGAGRSGDGKAPASGGFDMTWSHIVRHPDRSHDVGIATEHRAGVLAPRLTFWCRSGHGDLMERSIPLPLRDNAFRCLRFRNGHAVRVALLQGLAEKGLRFDPEVFVEAGVDPESWRPLLSPRRFQWLIVAVTVALILLTASMAWPVGWIVLCVLATLGLGYGATLAIRRVDPRLSRIIVFRPFVARSRTAGD